MNTETYKFPTLNPEDIDIRVGQKREKFSEFLLYKNARVDMNILDSVIGPDKWSRDHKEVKGNLYCGVGIEVEPGRVVWKWDCGSESNVEKEKGEASDSFKRACVNWGIGRELYTTPRIRIWADKLEFEGNYLKSSLAVTKMDFYPNSRRISDLTIENLDTMTEVWKMVGGVVVIGVGAKPMNFSSAGVHKPVTVKDYEDGKCVNLINELAKHNPSDPNDWGRAKEAIRHRKGADKELILDIPAEVMVKIENDAKQKILFN